MAPVDDAGGDDGPSALTDVGGIDGSRASSLRGAGYHDVEDLRAASEEDLAAVDGISGPLASRIKVEVGESGAGAEGGDRPSSGEPTAAAPRRGRGGYYDSVDWDRPPGRSPFFQERLTYPGSPDRLPVTYKILLGVVLGPGVFLFFFGLASGFPLWTTFLTAGMWLVGAGVVVGLGVATTRLTDRGDQGGDVDWEYRTQVSDEGLSVEVVWADRPAETEVAIPFGAITDVHFDDYGGTAVGVSGRTAIDAMDENGGVAPRQFSFYQDLAGLVDYDRGLVRVERGEDAPVYVASERPVELARAVVANAPAVDRPGPLYL